jgi:hypothetical protein
MENHGFDDVEARTFTKPMVLRATTYGPLKGYRLLDDRGYRTVIDGLGRRRR